MMSQLRVRAVFVAALSTACGSTTTDKSGEAAGTGGGGLGGLAGASSGGTASGGTAGTGGSGAGGTGGAPNCAGICGSAGCPACEGPAMMPATTLEGDPYRIDSTEVTNADYEKFLFAAVNPTTQPADCSWNTTFVPNTSDVGCTAAVYDPVNRADYPVVCVDWCDARAYCEWAGKRLCMHTGGAPTNGAPAAEWTGACSAQFTKTFPYADTYDPAACNGKDHGTAALVPVASLTTCEGGTPGLHDLSGNAREWAGSCDGAGADAECSSLGGSYKSPENSLKCFGGVNTIPARSFVTNDLGFRCCADPVQ